MLRHLTIFLLMSMLLAGCSGGPKPAPVKPQGQELSADESRKVRENARYSTTLNSMRLFLYAADEESFVEGESWCGGEQGKTGYTGTYRWYLEPAKDQPLLEQPAEVTGPDGPLHFGGGREMIKELTLGKQKFLQIDQYFSCTMQAVQLFGLDEANTLKRFPFTFADGTVTETPGTSTGVEVKGDLLHTGFYDRAKTYGGGWILRSWALQDGTFVEVKTEKME